MWSPLYLKEVPEVSVDINLDDNESTTSLVSDLESFDLKAKPLLKATEKIEKKKEKKAKKKKKDPLSEALTDALTMIEPSQLDEKKVDEVDMIDYYALIRDEFEKEVSGEDDFDDIVSENTGSRKKKIDSEYKKEFASNLDLLYNLLKNARDFESKIEKQYDNLNGGGKVRGISKYTIDMANAVVQARNNTLSIIKEINSVKKTAVDLQMKADSKKETNEGGQSNEMIASAFLNNIMNGYGRGNIMRDMMGNSSGGYYEDDEDEVVGEMIASLGGNGALSKYKHDVYMDKIQDRLDSEENHYRSEEGNAYIQYEHLEPKIMVKLCIDDGEYKFIAVDKDNQEIYGYPLPSQDSVGRLTFSSDNNYATDSKGRSYKVIQYFK